jgi:hypothetical protein
MKTLSVDRSWIQFAHEAAKTDGAPEAIRLFEYPIKNGKTLVPVIDVGCLKELKSAAELYAGDEVEEDDVPIRAARLVRRLNKVLADGIPCTPPRVGEAS